MNLKMKWLIAITIYWVASLSSFAQVNQATMINTVEQCGFDHFHQEMMQNDPDYHQRTMDFRNYVNNYALPKVATTNYKVPVVIHIMGDGTALTEISDEEIRAGIKNLNNRYRKVPGSLGDGNGVDVGVEFVLAARDPNGNCTNGIVRYDLSGDPVYSASGVFRQSAGISDAALKAYSVWDQTKYYNIWLVSEIDNNNGGAGIQGYALFASAHGTPADGSVILVGNWKDETSTTAAHEMGHAFNLYHTFQGDNNGASCPTNGSCSSDGDEVCDTPPHIRSSSNCASGTNACDGGSSNDLFIHNYLDYSSDNCQSEFTAGQKTRIIAALTGPRSSFLASNGNMSLVPPSMHDAFFEVSSTFVCAGSSVQFTDLSSCIPNNYLDATNWPGITFNWTITNGTSTYNSSLQNPLINFANAGTYDATLTITTGHGTDSYSMQGAVVVGASAATACSTNSVNEGNFWQTVTNVSFNSINKTTDLYENTAYTDFSCTDNTVVAAGGTYPISITLHADSGSEEVRVYIDYNNNGTFEAGEEVFNGTVASGVNTVTGNITISGTAVTNTLLRMRVVGDEGTVTLSEANCGANLYVGDVEDYGVYISPNVADVSVAVTPSSTVTYGTNVMFTATPVNGGASPSYVWYVNGIPQAGFTGNTFNSTALLDGDQVYCTMTSNLTGVIGSPATSNTITMSVTGVPLTDFSGAPLTLCAGGTVTFNDESLLAPTSWNWTFTGGTPATSTLQNPTVTYNAPGVYSVTLVASNGIGTGTTETKTGYVNVFATPGGICSSFTRTDAPSGAIGITKVALNTINHSTPYDDAVYQDFSCNNNTILTPNTTYDIGVTVSTINNQWVRVYIDYNQDGSFDGSELVFSPTNGQGVRSGTFTTPAAPVADQILRMRVISDFVNTTPGACTASLQFGQVEDYGVIFASSTCTAPAVTSNPNNTTVCDGENSSFTVSTSGTTPMNYQWELSTNNGATWSNVSNSGIYSNATTSTLNLTAATPAENGYQYRCVITNACGTVTSTEAEITVNTIPTAPTVAVVNNCGSSTLTATGMNLIWSTTETTSAITVTSAGTYTVTQTVDGCTSSQGSGVAAPVTVPVISAGTVIDPTTCSGTNGSIVINGTGTGTVSWTGTAVGNSGAVTLPYTITGLSAGSYAITFDIAGCSSNVLNESLSDPAIPAAPNVTVMNHCDFSTLTAVGTNLMWSTTETSDTIVVTTSGTYTVNQTVNGCTSNNASVNVTIVSIPPTPVVTVTDECGQSVLVATGINLEWSTTETTDTIIVTTSGNYSVNQTVNGCVSPDASVVANPIPLPAAPVVTSNGDLVFCEGDSVELTSSIQNNIEWSTSDTTATIIVDSTGVYTVDHIDPSTGCSATSNAISVVVNPLPTVTFDPLSDVCYDAPVFALSGGSPSGGEYSGAGVASGDFKPLLAGIGTHDILYTYTDANGCQNSATSAITVDDCANIESLLNVDLQVYPNPVTDHLTIKAEGVNIQGIRIFDLTGKLVKEVSTNGSELMLEMDSFASGEYLLQINTDRGVYGKSIVME